MWHTTSAGRRKRFTWGRGNVEAQYLETAPPCLSPEHIAELIRGSSALPTEDEAALCIGVLRRAVFSVTAPRATRLDYPPFALSAGESASLAVQALEGIVAVVYLLGDRGTLSMEVVERLTETLGDAMRELEDTSNALGGP